ncbi:glycosyl hydrolase family 28-related protein [Planctomycetota bacterium]
MKTAGTISLVFLLAAVCAAEGIDLGGLKVEQERLAPWRPGIEGGIPAVPVQIDARKYGAVADDKTDNSPFIQRAINAVKPPGAVLLPAGTYLLRETLHLKPGVVLRGEDRNKTTLNFRYYDRRKKRWLYPPVIRIAPGGEGWDPRFIEKHQEIDVPLKESYERGKRQVTTFNPSRLQAGQYVAIVANNDPVVHNTTEPWLHKSWYDKVNIIGQVLKITKVDGPSISIDRPLYREWRMKMMPRLRPLTVIERAGVENLHIITKQSGHVIDIKNAVECWVKNCHLEYSTRTHVSVSASLRVVVRDNYIHHGHSYDGGDAYGVWLGHWSSDCLVENNTFDNLRHSMVTTLGACGNVFGYNSSTNSRHPGKADDLCQHGFYSYANLFEGNVGIQAVFSDYWGPLGPYNTCYRNRLTKGILVRDSTHYTNILANSLIGGEIKVETSCREAWNEKNLLVFTNDTPTPPGTDGLAGNLEGEVTEVFPPPEWKIPASLYLKQKPSFWGTRPWPGIGAEVDLDAVRERKPFPLIPSQQK